MGIEKIGAVRRILATVTPPAYTGNGAFPSALHIGAIAALHTGHIENETERARACEDVVSALVFATREASELVFEDREYKREPWIEGSIQKGFHVIAAAWIKAADVCAWFASKQSPPGPLLAFWLAQVPCSGFDELAPGAASTAAIRLEDVDSFERMCQYRQQFAHLESQKRPPWTPKERCFLLQRHEDGVSIAGMARAFGLKSEGSIKRQLAQAKKERKKAQDAAAPANQNPPQNPFQNVVKTLART